MASGERSEATHQRSRIQQQQDPAAAGSSSSRSQQQQEPAAFFFLCCCFCGCRLSAAAARALLPRMARGERKRSPHRSRISAAAELNFEMLIVVNNKFVEELAFVVFVFKNLGGTV